MIRPDPTTHKPSSTPAPSKLAAPLRGIIPPLVTPLAARQHLDVPGLARLVEHVICGGVHGVFVLGTTGEAASLDDDLRREMVSRTCRLVAGRVPVLVGVTDTRVAESLRLARFAADAGASAVVVSTPYYLPLEQQEVVTFVKTLAAQQPLPLFLYNIPALSKTPYETETVVRLAELPKVMGIKDSSGDPSYLLSLREKISREDWSFFVGTEALLSDAVVSGSHGCVAGGANLDPGLFVSLYDAALRGDAARVAALHERLLMLDRIYRLSPGAAAIVRGLKCALECLGICGRRMGEPMRACSEAECKVVERYVAELGLGRVKTAVDEVAAPAAGRLEVRTATRESARAARVATGGKAIGARSGR
jgi:4-hydroxy-tetrahydrodipicolinate synthase